MRIYVVQAMCLCSIRMSKSQCVSERETLSMLAGSLSMGAMLMGGSHGGERGGVFPCFSLTMWLPIKFIIQIKERQPLVGYVYYVSQADKKKYIVQERH